MKSINYKLICCVVLIFACCFNSYTQENNLQIQEPESPIKYRYFELIAKIDGAGNTTIEMQSPNGSEHFNTNELNGFFIGMMELQKQYNKGNTYLFDPTIIVRADKSLRFSSVVKTIQSMRVSDDINVRVEINDKYAFVPRKPKNNVDGCQNFHTNPLALVVQLDSSGNLKLNMQNQGNIDDTVTIEQELKEILEARKADNRFHGLKDSVETNSVSIKAGLSIKFANVVRLFNAVRNAGAWPIMLQVDALK